MELLTAEQMRETERRAMASGAVTGLELMVRAGRGVVGAILARWPYFAEGLGRATVLCGPGNNGGDGFVVASELAALGWSVRLFFHGERAKLPPDAAECAVRWEQAGAVRDWSVEDIAAAGADLVVDALFGTGLSRAIPRDAALGVSAAISAHGGKDARSPVLVAVDCPSGLSCDLGALLLPDSPGADAEPLTHDGESGGGGDDAPYSSVRADLTVSFHRAKVGHYLGDGPAYCGALATVDIGLEPWATPTAMHSPPAAGQLRLVAPDDGSGAAGKWARTILGLTRSPLHKYQRGHVLVLSGGPGKGGAARLAARSALRAGAGLATIAAPDGAIAEHAAQLNAVMLRPFAGAAGLNDILADARFSAVCLGPGLGVGADARALVETALEAGASGQGGSAVGDRRIVIDADAITSFQQDPTALFRRLHVGCVLTPHEGEFARLFPDLSEKRRASDGVSKVDAARIAADRAGCALVLKGHDTVIASPGGYVSLHASVYDRSAPWLGTAGAGDVLAGLIAGLIAAPAMPCALHQAVEFAVWLHAEAARQFGPGLIAEDLPEMTPYVYRTIGL